MEFPKEMPPELKELLEKLMKSAPDGMQGFVAAVPRHRDYSTWVQVGKLTGSERLESAKYNRKQSQITQKMKILVARLERLEAEKSENHGRYWQMIYDNHSLPHDCSYTVQPKTGVILKDPEGKQEGCDHDH